MSIKSMTFGFIGFITFGFAAMVFAHARLDPAKSLKPRSDADNHKTGPCGSDDPTTDPTKRTTLIAGESIDIEWEETVNHPGWFRIAFSKDGTTGFDANVLKDNITDTQNGNVTRSDPNTYHKYKVSIKIPDEPCENCSIQLIQVMTDRTPPTNYYSCADIKIVAAEGKAPKTPTGLKVELIDGGDDD